MQAVIERFRFDTAAAPARDPRFDELAREVLLEEASVPPTPTMRKQATDREHRKRAGKNVNFRPMPALPEKPAKERLLELARAVEAGWRDRDVREAERREALLVRRIREGRQA